MAAHPCGPVEDHLSGADEEDIARLQLSLEPVLHVAVSTKSNRGELIDVPVRVSAESTERLRDRRPADSGRRSVQTVHDRPEHKIAGVPYRGELRPCPAPEIGLDVGHRPPP